MKNYNLKGYLYFSQNDCGPILLCFIYFTNICDPLCENPVKVKKFAKEIFAVFYKKKITLHMVKNILWKCHLYIFNIDSVRSCQRLKL